MAGEEKKLMKKKMTEDAVKLEKLTQKMEDRQLEAGFWM